MAKGSGGSTGKAMALGLGAGALSSAGGTTLTTCSSTDQTNYCKMVRFINTIKMLLFLVGIVVVAFLVWRVARR